MYKFIQNTQKLRMKLLNRRIPSFEYKLTKQMAQEDWDEIETLAAVHLNSTDGLVENLKERERIASYRYEGEIICLAALEYYPLNFEGNRYCAIYTGNTWVRDDWRNRNLTQFISFVSMIQAKARFPRHKLFWFFGSNNFMSYRAAYSSFDHFWPSPHHNTPPEIHRYMYELGKYFFDDTVDSETLVWSSPVARSFKDKDTTMSDREKCDPYLQHYCKINPGYVKGDRIMCLVPLSAASIRSLIKRVGVKFTRI